MAAVGVFFGTFNPMHLSHLRLAHELLAARGLDRLYVHCTVIPKTDRDALANGEIRIAGYNEGRVVYDTTAAADPARNYFRTGREFYSYETRHEMARLALAEGGADPRIVLLDRQDLYLKEGFAGIIRQVRDMHPGASLHGVHGDDAGGMLVRGIYEKEGVEALQFTRYDDISATRIRDGAAGLTTPGVDALVMMMRAGAPAFDVNGAFYRFDGFRLMRGVSGARRLASF